jgi:ATP-binding cassette subfamily C (CFTR/MRP) protein 4
VNGSPTGATHLKKLRQGISIIPQEPVIFSDSVRANLDPFDQFTDEEIWNALRQVELADYISSTEKKLDHFLEERGQNFSVGQKQLICLARALLKKNKILVIDEATANVDPRTDNLIQKTIRTEFKECTVITIAHQTQTIIDSDRIGVMSNGKILEIDSPKNLLSNPESAFYGIVQESKDRSALMKEAGARFNTISSTEHALGEEQVKPDKMHIEHVVLSTSF